MRDLYIQENYVYSEKVFNLAALQFSRKLSKFQRVMVGSPPVLAFAAICAACIFGMVEVARAQDQNGTSAVTDPAEARALNSIFQQWGISARSDQWNISGELCSGAAIDTTSFDDGNYNPFIKCDCSYNSSSTCHITQLKVYALDVVGIIPEQLWTLTYLINLYGFFSL
ncbi:hypothetical protein I3760_11G061000 [Carya illinoinensis]|nr:hypothetical protein I3760_11G061000 [Carya illinoinensis]